VLANPSYIQKFSYISCSVPDRADYIVDDDSNEDNDDEQSDIVGLALNLAYVSEKHVEGLKLGQGGLAEIVVPKTPKAADKAQ